MKPSSKQTHGELLRKLLTWYPKTIREFAIAVDYSEKKIYELKKQERLPEKTLLKISRGINIPLSYWEGKYELPLKGTGEDSQYKDILKIENDKLKTENIELSRVVRKLQEKIIEMQDQLLNFLPSPQKTGR